MDEDGVIDWTALDDAQLWLEHGLSGLEQWLLTKVLTWPTLGQLALIAVTVFIAYQAARPLQDRLATAVTRLKWHEQTLEKITRVGRTLAFPAIAVGLLWLAIAIVAAFGWPYVLLKTTGSLLIVWIIIRVTSGVIEDETIARTIAVLAFVAVTLDILDLLSPALAFLDRYGVHLGSIYISVLSVLKGAMAFTILMWLALTTARVLEQRIARLQGLTPSLKVLTGKLMRAGLIVVAFLIALGSIGINLTALAVFTGAIGVGIGFGLQKLVSNLISGVILLLDRSIKPGDVIEIGDTFGWVSALNARYASVTTRDGKEYLIPNEDLITQQVTNWSFSSDRLRLGIPFGIAYDSNVKRAMALAVECARDVPRVLKDPAPVCRLMAFGESSVDFELRIWIRDPENGVVNVRSAVLLNIWEQFGANGINFPFPQRDLHIRSAPALTVNVSGGGERKPT